MTKYIVNMDRSDVNKNVVLIKNSLLLEVLRISWKKCEIYLTIFSLINIYIPLLLRHKLKVFVVEFGYAKR